MGKGPATTIAYVILAIFFLLLISFSPRKPRVHPHRRLRLRSSFSFDKHERIPFDPLVAEIERRREDKEWEKQYFADHHNEFVSEAAPTAESQSEWEDFMDAEDYLNDEDRFNVTQRIIMLFPKVDLDPTDGFVSLDELTEWNLMNAEKEVVHRTERDMDAHDKNHDMLISFQEYEAPSWSRRSHGDSDDMGWWKEDHFNASDVDGDGFLNKTEFNDFLHPADSKNPKLLSWLSKEEVRERDSDNDGKLNFQEFFHGIFDLISSYDQEGYNASHRSSDSLESPAKKMFADLDHDKDGHLSPEELLPVIDKIHPTERYYAKQQADYVIMQADADKDGRLTLEEMIDHPYVFYSAIFNDDENDDYFHDEFR
ncbi:uncharacterized protein [Aristolochia californica]|uniref:uncharacterized protein n=1 Tax=Aristolochia californica TaxID=171875 RepID=UPI0035D5BAA8